LSDRQYIQVNSDACYELDVSTFISLIVEGEPERLATAVDLYRGDFLADFYLEDSNKFEEWAARWRSRLRRQALEAFNRLVAHHLECSEAEEAVSYARRQLEIDNLRESAHRQLIMALNQLGKRAEAIRQYESCRDLLRKELGVAPSAETDALAASIRREYEAGPARSRLPEPETPLIGREVELAGVLSLLRDGARLVSIVGPGGIGKTRLALEVAHRIAAESDGARAEGAGPGIRVAFIDLVSISEAPNLVPAMARALEMAFEKGDWVDLKRLLLDYLKGKEMLLLLDNFEHMLDGVSLLNEILQAAPRVKLLVTSRERLRLQAEHVFPLAGLGYSGRTPPWTTPVEANRDPAVQLFRHHARRVRPAFRLRGEHLTPLQEIIHLTEGMPLALILAAGWVRALDLAEIVTELDQSLGFLEATHRDVPHRQRSMRTVFDATWQRLSQRLRTIFAALSIFRGGFTRSAAEEVTGATAGDLIRLVDHSLLTRRQGGRYQVHELLRQFAEGKLARQPDLWVVVNDQHSAYHLALLQSHKPRWHTDRQLETLATIALESDNITVAWGWALATGAWEQLAGAMDNWGHYHHWQGLFTEGNALCAVLEARLKRVMNFTETDPFICSTLWVKALAWQGIFLSTIEEALAKLEESLAFLERQNHNEPQIRRLKAFVLRQMASRLTPVAAEKAHRCATQALQLSLGLEDGWQMAESHFYLGLLYWKLGQIEDAQKSTEIALAMFREMGDRRMLVSSEIILAWIIQAKGNFTSAERLRYKTLDLCRQLGDRLSLIHCLGDLAQTLILCGKLDDSLRSAENCVALSVEYSLREKEGWARTTLGNSLMHQGYYDQAQREFERALKLVQETGNQDVEIKLWAGLGYLVLIPGDDGREAQTFFEKALRLSNQVEDEFFLGLSLGGLLLANCQAGASERARQRAIIYLEYAIRIRVYRWLNEALATVAFYLARFDNKQKALWVWQQASRQPYIKASQWYNDVIGREIDMLTAGLSPLPTAAVTNHDLWKTAESLLADLK
jgi:predicted ATPase